MRHVEGSGHAANNLPDDMWRKVLRVSNPQERASLACASRQLYNLAGEDEFLGVDATADGAAEFRDAWRASLKGLSSFGRWSLKSAFQHACSGHARETIDDMRKVAADCQLRSQAPIEPRPVWKTLSVALLQRLHELVAKGDLTAFQRARSSYAEAIQKCGVECSTPELDAMEVACARNALVKAIKDFKLDCTSGHSFHLSHRLEAIQSIAKTAQMEASDLENLEKFHATMSFCRVLHRIENDSNIYSIGVLHLMVSVGEEAVKNLKAHPQPALYRAAIECCRKFIGSSLNAGAEETIAQYASLAKGAENET